MRQNISSIFLFYFLLKEIKPDVKISILDFFVILAKDR
jgi:hypothetical protein